MTVRPTLALAVAGAAGVTSLVAHIVAAETAATPAPAVVDGEFTWGIKASFMKYLTGFAQGQVDATDGATYGEDQEFTFPVDADDSRIDADGTGEIALDGSLHVRPRGARLGRRLGAGRRLQ